MDSQNNQVTSPIRTANGNETKDPNHAAPPRVPPPHLLNPLLDSIFNNQTPYKSPIKGIIDTLSKNHNDYTILVPTTQVLQSRYDPAAESSSTKIRLRDLCYHNEDFIKSHIIRTSQPISSKMSNPSSKVLLIIYNTINGKQILAKNGVLFPGKGFGKSLTIKILKIDYFHSVANYFPQGSKFMIIYIEDSIMGSYLPKPNASSQFPEVAPFTKIIFPNSDLPPSSKNEYKSKPLIMALKPTSKANIDSITFEKLLRSFPLLSKSVSDKFYRLFHHNNYEFQILRPNRVKDLESIDQEFHEILERAFQIVQSSVDAADSPNGEATFELMNNILKSYPGLDLNKLIHEYVELNLYDKVWSQLIYQFSNSTRSLDRLSYLSLNQLDISIVKPWQLNELSKRIYLSIEEFRKLNDSSIVNLQSKTKILVRTIELLTTSTVKNSSDNLLIDADTLIGLFMMVIIHSNIEYLEAHLYYIKSFNSTSLSNDGYLNYILSNFDAVLLHFSSEKDEKHLRQLSQENYKFLSYIESGEVDKIREVFDKISADELPSNHFLRSKNIHGESFLMRAIKCRNFEVYKLLMEYNPNWFSIDDILFDKNTQNDQTLLMCSIIEECEDITNHLIEVIQKNCTIREQIAYFNCQDSIKRTVGHYLHHNIELIDLLGPFLDWELKDLQSQTPLFCLCRCYDHPKYEELIVKSFNQVHVTSLSFNSDVHNDKNGNTLLHIIQRNLSDSKLLSAPAIDINEFNNKAMTPLALYVKFNRIDNLREILEDDRLDFKKEDQIQYLNALDHAIGNFNSSNTSNNEESIEVENMLTEYHFKNSIEPKVEHKILAFNARFDQNKKDWVVYFKIEENEKIEDKDVETNPRVRWRSSVESVEEISQNIYLMKLQFPTSILPLKDLFFQNFPPISTTAVYPSFNKFKINRFIEDVNIFLLSLNYHPKYCDTPIIWERYQNPAFARKKLTLELIKEIKNTTEINRVQLGDVKLDTSKIQEIEFFLNFSMNDLLTFKSVSLKFNKVLSLLDWKVNDLRFVLDGFLENWILSVGANSIKRKLLQNLHSSNNNRNPLSTQLHESTGYGNLLRYTTLLLLYVTELTQNVTKTLDRIDNWKQLHSSIIEINGEIRKYENTQVTNTIATNEGVSNEEYQQNSDTLSSFFNFSSIIESKQTKYKKLLYSKAEMIKKILSLNVDLKLEHEALAAEISSFLKFKAEFLIFSFKFFAKTSAKLTKERMRELEWYKKKISN